MLTLKKKEKRMKKYKNRESLIGRLHVLRRNIRDMYEKNSELLVGAEITMLRSAEEKLKHITHRQKKRKENK